MILFLKFFMALVAFFIILVFIDLINAIRGRPSNYTETCAFISEGFQFLCAMALGVFFCGLALLFCGLFIFG